MIWIVRILLYIAAPITALFVARDALNFARVAAQLPSQQHTIRSSFKPSVWI